MGLWRPRRRNRIEDSRAVERAPPFELDKELEEEQNRETTPPDGEAIEVQCMYLVEGYLPAHVPGLLRGMRDVGWDAESSMRSSPFEWVRESREAGGSGAWAPVGHLVRESRGLGGDYWRMDLPEGVDHAYAAFWAISPGLTVLTVQFVFGDDQALVLDGILRRTYSSYTTPIDRGWQVHDPANQKRAALMKARGELRARCGAWLGARVPGAFAGGLLAGDWPAVEVLTAHDFEPFAGDDRTGAWDYRELLGLARGPDVYASSQVEGLRLSLPGPFDKAGHVMTAAGAKPKLFSEANLGSYGGAGPRGAFANWLHHRLDDVVASWACLHLVRGYQGALSAERDRLVDDARETETDATLASLDQMRRELFPRARDAQVLGAELELLSESEFSMPFRGLDWERTWDHPDTRTLGAQWRDQCGYLARVLGTTEARLREALATDAQLGVAATNLVLQHQVTVLTRVSIGIAVVAVIVALVLS